MNFSKSRLAKQSIPSTAPRVAHRGWSGLAPVAALKRRLPAVLPESLLLALRREWLARAARRGEAIQEVEFTVLPALLRPGMTAIDVGANIGGYTLAMARLVGSRGQVAAIEPLRENCAVIRAAQRGGANLAPIQILEMAVCERPGRLSIGIPRSGFDRFYLATLSAGTGQDAETREIEGASLDSLQRAGVLPSDPAFIKMDVEGAELRALRGATQILRQGRAIWLIEVSAPTAAEVWDLMTGCGYEASFLRQRRWIQAPAPVARQSNFFFFPRGTVLPPPC